jgi:signal recognition particle GTPase
MEAHLTHRNTSQEVMKKMEAHLTHRNTSQEVMKKIIEKVKQILNVTRDEHKSCVNIKIITQPFESMYSFV